MTNKRGDKFFGKKGGKFERKQSERREARSGRKESEKEEVIDNSSLPRTRGSTVIKQTTKHRSFAGRNIVSTANERLFDISRSSGYEEQEFGRSSSLPSGYARELLKLFFEKLCMYENRDIRLYRSAPFLSHKSTLIARADNRKYHKQIRRIIICINAHRHVYLVILN